MKYEECVVVVAKQLELEPAQSEAGENEVRDAEEKITRGDVADPVVDFLQSVDLHDPLELLFLLIDYSVHEDGQRER